MAEPIGSTPSSPPPLAISEVRGPQGFQGGRQKWRTMSNYGRFLITLFRGDARTHDGSYSYGPSAIQWAGTLV